VRGPGPGLRQTSTGYPVVQRSRSSFLLSERPARHGPSVRNDCCFLINQNRHETQQAGGLDVKCIWAFDSGEPAFPEVQEKKPDVVVSSDRVLRFLGFAVLLVFRLLLLLDEYVVRGNIPGVVNADK
jgi:hypothetical protein